MQILEYHHDRLDLALAEEQVLHSLEGALALLGGIEPGPFTVLGRDVEESKQCGQRGLEPTIQGEDLAGNPLADLPPIVPLLDLEVALEQVDDRQVGRGLSEGHRARLQDQPAAGAVGVYELPVQARLADARLPHHGDDLSVSGAGPL